MSRRDTRTAIADGMCAQEVGKALAQIFGGFEQSRGREVVGAGQTDRAGNVSCYWVDGLLFAAKTLSAASIHELM